VTLQQGKRTECNRISNSSEEICILCGRGFIEFIYHRSPIFSRNFSALKGTWNKAVLTTTAWETLTRNAERQGRISREFIVVVDAIIFSSNLTRTTNSFTETFPSPVAVWSVQQNVTAVQITLASCFPFDPTSDPKWVFQASVNRAFLELMFF